MDDPLPAPYTFDWTTNIEWIYFQVFSFLFTLLLQLHQSTYIQLSIHIWLNHKYSVYFARSLGSIFTGQLSLKVDRATHLLVYLYFLWQELLTLWWATRDPDSTAIKNKQYSQSSHKTWEWIYVGKKPFGTTTIALNIAVKIALSIYGWSRWAQIYKWNSFEKLPAISDNTI